MTEKYDIFCLDNGIKLIHKETSGKVAHCGLILNTGSRDEDVNEWGMAHFIEHVIFKGTKKRKSYHVLSRLEDVGGDLNAYTTKEDTCIYAAFLDEHYERTIELISDIAFNPVFPEKELEKEKEVILDEINSYKDSPSELIFDDFEELVFCHDPIGRNILGTPKHVKSFKREDVLSFIEKKYNTDQMVICSVGNIDFSKLKRLVEKYFGHIEANIRKDRRVAPQLYVPVYSEVVKNTHQTHCMLGNIAYDANNPKRYALSLLTNILGGPGLNSRLNLSLREKHGLAYNVEANYTPYSDTGLFSVYFGTDGENFERSLAICKKEMEKLRNRKLGVVQLKRAKQQMIGQMAISSENNENLMLTIGKSILLYNKVDTLEEIISKIEALTAEDLMDTANEIFDPNKITTLIYK